MKSISWFQKFARDQLGATVIEYAMIASLISVLIMFGATDIGTRLLEIFSDAGNGLK